MAKAKKPNFVMKKSAWTVIRFWHIFPFLLSSIFMVVIYGMNNWNFSAVPAPWNILAFALLALSFVIPFIVLLIKIINIKDESISFYANKVVHESGIFGKQVHTNILTHVLSVTVKQTFWGRVFKYGTITIDVMGQWDIDMTGIKNPMKAKAFLETIAANGMGMTHVLMN